VLERKRETIVFIVFSCGNRKEITDMLKRTIVFIFLCIVMTLRPLSQARHEWVVGTVDLY